MSDLLDESLRDDDHRPWSVHDGQFFASHIIRENRARAPAERRLSSSEQLSSWVEGMSDFVSGGINPPSLNTGLPRRPPSAGATDDYLSALAGPSLQALEAQEAWSVHDGQLFAQHVRQKRPRAPAERRMHRRGGDFLLDAKRWSAPPAAHLATQPFIFIPALPSPGPALTRPCPDRTGRALGLSGVPPPPRRRSP